MSRRDGVIVAWHEVPGKAPAQKSRPVGDGVMRAGVRTDSIRRSGLRTFNVCVPLHCWHTQSRILSGAPRTLNVERRTSVTWHEVPGSWEEQFKFPPGSVHAT